MKLSRRNFVKLCGAGTALAGLGGIAGGDALAAPDEAPARPGGREILPIPDIPQPYPSALYGKDVQPTPTKPLRPPDGAPNVVIILIDDMGFGATSAFGGPIHMPNPGARGSRRPEVQPLPHHRALLANPSSAAHWSQPSFCRHGQHH